MNWRIWCEAWMNMGHRTRPSPNAHTAGNLLAVLQVFGDNCRLALQPWLQTMDQPQKKSCETTFVAGMRHPCGGAIFLVLFHFFVCVQKPDKGTRRVCLPRINYIIIIVNPSIYKLELFASFSAMSLQKRFSFNAVKCCQRQGYLSVRQTMQRGTLNLGNV